MQWDAVVNAILSFIIPGVGQAINGDKKKGIIMFIQSMLFTVHLMHTEHTDFLEVHYGKFHNFSF